MPSARSRALVATALAAPFLLVAPLVGTGSAAAAVDLPDPCQSSPANLVAAVLGAPSKHAPKGVLTSGKVDGLAAKTCTFTYKTKRLQVIFGSAAMGDSGYGGPPGMVVSHPASLGPKGVYLYDLKPKFYFASASFVKGAIYGSTSSDALQPPSHVLALTVYMYNHVP